LHPSLVILGAGYTARFLLPLALRRYSYVLATSRYPDRHLGHLPPDRRIRFDLMQPLTWPNIPGATDLLWCFPAMPLDLVKQFAMAASLPRRRLVILGSTSAYGTVAASGYPPAWIDETGLIDLTKQRVQGEEFLRVDCGAIVLRVAGIYGPGRNPLDWIKTGRVSPTRKFVNLIHVEDLAALCLISLDQGKQGEVYNVSDGTPRTWKEICETAQRRWKVALAPIKQPDKNGGKRISISKLSNDFNYTMKYPDLYEGLEGLSREADKGSR
jgi:nucleoside-diphosphate-sugar epimerase